MLGPAPSLAPFLVSLFFYFDLVEAGRGGDAASLRPRLGIINVKAGWNEWWW